MGISWQNGKRPEQIAALLRARLSELKDGGLRAIDESVNDGGMAMQDALEAAVTGTGILRVARGGISAGRHLTGNFVASVGNDGDHPEDDGNGIVWGSFGVFADDFEEYMRKQDLGYGNIPAAGAMSSAFVLAREAYRDRLRALIRARR